MADLFSPFTLESVTLRNRIGVSPMCMYSALEGEANDWHFMHYGSRANGGAGLVIVEATAVTPEGRITPGDLGLWNDEQTEALERIAVFLADRGSVAGIQLAHAGRKASAARPWEGRSHLAEGAGGWPTLAPSAIAFGGELPKVPTEMTTADIARVQTAFTNSAKRAFVAGFEWLEIHAAHGYLAHEFLSPISNRRTDRYGGSYENRIRFLLETVKGVRAVWPTGLPLTVRLSCTDWVEEGWSLDESVELAKRLRAEGVSLIDCSSGGMVPDAKVPNTAGYQVPFSDRIRREAQIATAAVGLIREPAQAAQILGEGRADIVLLARAILNDPHWPIHAAEMLGQAGRLPPPLQYERAFKARPSA